MNEKFLDALIPATMLSTVGGLLYSLHLLRHGKKRRGEYMILISVGLLLLLVALLSYFEGW